MVQGDIAVRRTAVQAADAHAFDCQITVVMHCTLMQDRDSGKQVRMLTAITHLRDRHICLQCQAAGRYAAEQQ